MTTIPYTSFETDTADWVKGEPVATEYEKIKTDISVDSSDLLVRFSNLPLGTRVAAPQTPISYEAENSPFYITIYDGDYDINNRITLYYTPYTANDSYVYWEYADEIFVRDSDGIVISEIYLTGNTLRVIENEDGVFLSGNFGYQILSGNYTNTPIDIDNYIVYQITNVFPDIRYVNNGRTVFEYVDSNKDLSITNHGSDAIINTYTKVDDNTIRIPRSMDGASPDLFATNQFNKLYVRFNR
jgi:hypothetical protein